MRSQMPAVRVSSHTIALCRGLPVWRSHSSIVSRWLVMPTARMLTCAEIGQVCIDSLPPTNEGHVSSSVIGGLSVYTARADGNRDATSMPSAWAASSAPAMQAVTPFQISSGSCSVHLHHQHGITLLCYSRVMITMHHKQHLKRPAVCSPVRTLRAECVEGTPPGVWLRQHPWRRR